MDVVEKNKSFIEKVKSMATLIASVGALLTALGSYMIPADDSMTQKSYYELSMEIKKINDVNIRQSDTINSLRGAIDVLIRTQQLSGYVEQNNALQRFNRRSYTNPIPEDISEINLLVIERPDEYEPRSYEQLKE